MSKIYKFIFLLSSVVFLSARVKAQAIKATDYNAKIDLGTLKYPNSLAVGDLNQDGRPDIVVANQGAAFVSVFANAKLSGTITSSSLAARQDFAVDSGAESILLSDLDGNGFPDLVLTHANTNKISVLRNTTTTGGALTFAPVQNIVVGYYSHRISLGDITGDGKAEIAVANFDAGVITLFQNTSASGSISFSPGIDLRTNGNPTCVQIGDVDKDSHPDVVVVLHDSGLVGIYRSLFTTGTLTEKSFAKRVDIQAGNSPYAVAVADLNNDNRPDLIVSNIDGRNNIAIYKNNTASGVINATTFQSKQDFPTGPHPYSINLQDVDGDGFLDVLSGNWYNTGTVSVLRNTTTGTNPISMAIKTDLSTGANPLSVASVDINNDSKPDLVTANSYDNTISLLQYLPFGSVQPQFPESTASKSVGSFVSTDLLDAEWTQQAPPGYTVASDDGSTINAAANGGTNAGRFAYFWVQGSRKPFTAVQGNLTFSAKGNGTIEVQLISTYDNSVQARKTFTLNSSPTVYTDYSWAIANLYPQMEYMIAVIFNGTYTSSQAKAAFKKSFCLNLQQMGLSGTYTRYRADLAQLIGNTETGWYGWSQQENVAKKKYLQHSAYARMRFTTTETKMVIEYVRDFYDKPVINLFPFAATRPNSDLSAYNGQIINGVHVVSDAVKVAEGRTYTISGLLTNKPVFVWYKNGQALTLPDTLRDTIRTPHAGLVYCIKAPPGATNLGLLVQRIINTSSLLSPYNDTYLAYVNCVVQEGSYGKLTPSGQPIPSPTVLFTGFRPSSISGPAVFINGSLYKYYQVEGSDLAKSVQYVMDDLPAGSKTVEIMMPGQGSYEGFDPMVRRGGTYLRAVYFPGTTTTTVQPAATAAANSVCFIHDSILSGFNISTTPQNNVWMMKIARDPAYGYTGDIFSEGYAGRILHTDTKTPVLIGKLATKLNSLPANVNRYWFQIGVNDYGFMTPLKDFYTEYSNLVDTLHKRRPAAKLYIQSTGPEFYEEGSGETYADDGITATGPTANDYRDVQRAIATKRSWCEFVDFEGLLKDKSKTNFIDTLADGIHPTDIGNTMYAQAIKNRSTLLGTVLPVKPLAFYRQDIRSFIQTVASISTITGTGGKAPYKFTKTSGTLPANLLLNIDGTITGTPSGNGKYPIVVRLTDTLGTYVEKTFNIVVVPAPVIKVGPYHLQNAQQNVAYSKKFNAYTGYGKYTFSLSGTVPAGWSVNPATGVLSGTPTTLNPISFRITATDHYNFVGYTNYTLNVGTVTPPLLIDSIKRTITIRNDSLFVTAHVSDIYQTYLFTFMGAYKTVGTTNSALGDGQLVNIEVGNMDSKPVFLGKVGTTWDKIWVHIGAISPSQLDGTTNLAYKEDEYFYH